MDIFRRKNSYGSLEERRSSNEASEDDKLLMAQSREQLTMDMTKSDNSIFKKPAGCYISRSKAFLLAAVFLIVAVAVGLITHNISKCSEDISRLSTGDDSSSGARKAAKVKDVRLPRNVRPLYYKLDLIPHVDPAKNFTLEGKVWIDMECLEETNKITIQIKNITIQEESVTLKEIDKAEGPVEEAHEHQHENEQENEHEDHHHHHGSFAVTQHHYDIPREFYNVTLNAKLRPGKIYRLYIQYVGELNDELAGFYRSSYKDKTTNETRWLAVTQFQPTDARRAFPCFDEPALKAKFEISIARRTQMTSISNMNLNKTVPMEGNDGWVWDHYTKSVAMSTYLVAFMVSDFEQRESDRSLSKPMFRVWARKDAINQVEYARDIGPKILTYYEQYFNVEFPLPKQDMVALPDFNAGAMENWGLITYRETAMLYDPKVSSDLNKLRIATVIAHELAHQWFGNLVTPSWWHDLWLNEGFASYVEYIGVDHVEPDWKVLEQFVCDEIQHVFSLDALDSSHPISIPVTHPDEINEIFDRISYSKGASVIRMMNHFLTEKTFKSGLTNYLIKWKYNSTKQTDLWDCLTEQAYSDKSMDIEMTVENVMDSWTLQKGFPVIQVDRSYETSETNFTQIKFQLIKNETVAKEYESYRWWVPISYSTREYNNDFSQTKPVFWLPRTKKTVSHNVLSNKTDDWLVVNVQQTGYYRVNYDQKNWQLIMDQLNTNASEIHIINRAQLVDDAFNLARATLLSYDTAFNITQYLRDENEYLPWESFLTAFSYISQMFLKSPSYGIFKKYMQGLLEKQYQRVGFNETSSDPLLEKYHRINILQWACAVDHKDCVGNAKQLYAEWMSSSAPNTNNPVPTNLRRLIYCAAIKNGGEKEWNFAWQRYLEANVASEKNTILNALACSKQIWILNRYLNWSVTTGSQIRKQDGPTVIKAIASSDIGNYLAFNFIRDKWSHIRTYFGSGFFSVGGIVNSISQRLNTEFELRELQNFKSRFQHELGSATRTVNQAIEGVQANVQWMADNFIVITKWLEKNTNAIPVDSRIQ